MKELHRVRGIVRRGNQLGRTLGYPTANMILHQDIRDGVYVSLTSIDRCPAALQKKYRSQMVEWNGKMWLRSLTFIGAAETFGGTKRKIETFILDFNGNLYTHWLTVSLLSYVRGSKKFKTVDDLLVAMNNDTTTARAYFEKFDL